MKNFNVAKLAFKTLLNCVFSLFCCKKAHPTAYNTARQGKSPLVQSFIALEQSMVQFYTFTLLNPPVLHAPSNLRLLPLCLTALLKSVSVFKSTVYWDKAFLKVLLLLFERLLFWLDRVLLLMTVFLVWTSWECWLILICVWLIIYTTRLNEISITFFKS